MYTKTTVVLTKNDLRKDVSPTMPFQEYTVSDFNHKITMAKADQIIFVDYGMNLIRVLKNKYTLKEFIHLNF